MYTRCLILYPIDIDSARLCLFSLLLYYLSLFMNSLPIQIATMFLCGHCVHVIIVPVAVKYLWIISVKFWKFVFKTLDLTATPTNLAN